MVTPEYRPTGWEFGFSAAELSHGGVSMGL
jgi:hypothetical protein